MNVKFMELSGAIITKNIICLLKITIEEIENVYTIVNHFDDNSEAYEIDIFNKQMIFARYEHAIEYKQQMEELYTTFILSKEDESTRLELQEFFDNLTETNDYEDYEKIKKEFKRISLKFNFDSLINIDLIQKLYSEIPYKIGI